MKRPIDRRNTVKLRQLIDAAGTTPESIGYDLELIAAFAVSSPGLSRGERTKVEKVARQMVPLRTALSFAVAARVDRFNLIEAAKRQSGRLLLDFERGQIEFTPVCDYSTEYRPAITQLLLDAAKSAAKN